MARYSNWHFRRRYFGAVGYLWQMARYSNVMRSARKDDGIAFDDYEKLKRGEISDRYVLDNYLSRYIDKSVRNGDFDSELVSLLKSEKKNANLTDVANISDMIEAQTGITGPFDAGHGVSYWFDRDKVPIEFFAEYVDSLSFNPSALNEIRDIFPNAAKVVEEIIDEVC